jgi:hypothetical protein
MAVSSYDELVECVGHDIECVVYGNGNDIRNVSVECMDCYMVLLDYDNPDSLDRRDIEWREMCEHGFPTLRNHVGHHFEVKKNGKTVKLMCVDCGTSLLQYSK